MPLEFSLWILSILAVSAPRAAAGSWGLWFSSQSPMLNLPFSGWSLMSASLGWLGLSDWLESEKHKKYSQNYRICERKWIRGARLSRKVQPRNQEWGCQENDVMNEKTVKETREGAGAWAFSPLCARSVIEALQNHSPKERWFPTHFLVTYILVSGNGFILHHTPLKLDSDHNKGRFLKLVLKSPDSSTDCRLMPLNFKGIECAGSNQYQTMLPEAQASPAANAFLQW